jgi:hypothetical protein
VFDGAEHGAHLGLFNPAAAVGNGLIQQAERIPHTAIGSPCQQAQGGRFGCNILGL